MSDMELKRCPFCGDEGEAIQTDIMFDTWTIRCKNPNCICHGITKTYNRAKYGIRRWNKREDA